MQVVQRWKVVGGVLCDGVGSLSGVGEGERRVYGQGHLRAEAVTKPARPKSLYLHDTLGALGGMAQLFCDLRLDAIEHTRENSARWKSTL